MLGKAPLSRWKIIDIKIVEYHFDTLSFYFLLTLQGVAIIINM